jgi:hypothetical protein
VAGLHDVLNEQMVQMFREADVRHGSGKVAPPPQPSGRRR